MVPVMRGPFLRSLDTGLRCCCLACLALLGGVGDDPGAGRQILQPPRLQDPFWLADPRGPRSDVEVRKNSEKIVGWLLQMH